MPTDQPPTPSPEQAAPEPEAPQSKYERAIAALRPAVPPAEAAPAAAPEPAAPAAENEDLKRAREQQAYLKYQRDAVEAKKRAADVEGKLKSYEVFEGKDPAALLAALKERGVTLETLARAQIAEPEPEPEHPEVVRLRARLDAMERERAEGQAAHVFRENVAFVSELLTKEAEKYPALAAFKRAPEELVKRFNAAVDKSGEPEDVLGLVHQIASDFNAAVYNDVDNILSSDAALKAYLARPEIKTRALSILGAKPSAGPASSEGDSSGGKGAPTAIPSTAAANSSARSAKPLTREEKFAAAVGNLKRIS